MESQSYEFNNTQERLIRELSDKMRFVSYFLIAIGALLIISGIARILIISGIARIGRGGFSGIINGIIQLLIGIWTNKAASSFRQIVDTRENDIENLINALGELRKLYALQYWLLILALIFIGIVRLAGIFLSLSTR